MTKFSGKQIEMMGWELGRSSGDFTKYWEVFWWSFVYKNLRGLFGWKCQNPIHDPWTWTIIYPLGDKVGVGSLSKANENSL